MLKSIKSKKVLTILIVTLICLESFFVFLSIKSFTHKDIIETKTKVNDVNRLHFNVYDMDNVTGKYIKRQTTTINNLDATNYVFDSNNSYCEDSNHVKSFDKLVVNGTSSVTLTSNTAQNCYIYYKLKNIYLNSYLKNNADNLWQSGLEDDGYRYVGLEPNNYICFGTTSQSDCKNNENLYLYRIIGIFKDGSNVEHVKIIKNTNVGSVPYSSSSSLLNNTTDDNVFYKANHGGFLTNTLYPYMQNTTWTNLITNWNYTLVNTVLDASGPNYYSGLNLGNVYLHELNKSGKTSTIGTWTTLSAKIGLIYVSDYSLSAGITTGSTSSSNFADANWIFQNGGNEWLLGRQSLVNKKGYEIDYDKTIYWAADTANQQYRPTFYLVSNALYNSGEGTYTNPYRISLS